jgi:hypothetical protein
VTPHGPSLCLLEIAEDHPDALLRPIQPWSRPRINESLDGGTLGDGVALNSDREREAQLRSLPEW